MKTSYDRLRWILPFRAKDLSIDPEEAVFEKLVPHQAAQPRPMLPMMVSIARVTRIILWTAAATGLFFLVRSCW